MNKHHKHTKLLNEFHKTFKELKLEINCAANPENGTILYPSILQDLINKASQSLENYIAEKND